MPTPPRIDILDQVKFITQYWWQGCDAPFSLIVQFSQQPAHDVQMLLFSLDWADILKAWLRPGGARERKPARHGKKHRNRGYNMDINELFGGKLRAAHGPYPGIDLPGSRMLFRISDQVDRFNWTAAIVESSAQLPFETLWGMLSAHPELCPQMIWVDAGRFEEQTFPGTFAETVPFGLIDYYSGNGVFGPDPFVFVSNQAELDVAFTGTVANHSGNMLTGFRFTLRGNTDTILAESSPVTLSPGESADLTLSGTLPKGVHGSICRSRIGGSAWGSHLRLLAFSNGQWL